MGERSHDRSETAEWERLLDAWRPLPAVLFDRHLDVLAATDVAPRLSEAFSVGENLARFAFLSPKRQFEHPRWRSAASATVALLRGFVDEHDEDRASRRLLGELATASRDFSEMWADPETRTRMTGPIVFEGTAVGTVACTYNILGMSGQDECALLVFVPADESGRAAIARLESSSSVSG
ncbi:hypothetical protein [Microbacterium sp. 1P10AE]|jgi:hypothetical protein|uniref:MmyB family transcriptional regulator n=1 Tax=Microbacterium sp. 1P10AE TaxID=3132286 RepID=UPI0039A19489